MSCFPPSALRKNRELRGLNLKRQTFIFSQIWSWGSEIRGSVWSGSGKISLPGLQLATRSPGDPQGGEREYSGVSACKAISPI